MKGDAQERTALFVAAAVVAVAVVPALASVALDVARAPSASLEALTNPRVAVLLARSTARAGAITAVALTIGLPLGVLFGRTDVAGRRVAWAAHAFPAFVPPFVLALGWFHLFGERGAIGSAWAARVLFGEAGAIAVMSLALA